MQACAFRFGKHVLALAKRICNSRDHAIGLHDSQGPIQQLALQISILRLAQFLVHWAPMPPPRV